MKRMLSLLLVLGLSTAVLAQEPMIIRQPVWVTHADGISLFDSDGGGQTRLRYEIVPVTSAQILALNSTPVTILSAPGSGKYIDVIKVDVIYDYATAYTITSAGDLRLYYGSRTGGNAASATIAVLGLLDASADTILTASGMVNGTNPPTTNLAVVLQNMNTVAYSGGTSTLRLAVLYRIQDTGL